MLAAFLGAVLVSQGAGHVTISSSGLIGDLMMVLACVFAAIYSIGGKQLAALYPADVVTALVATAGAVFLLPATLLEGLTLALPLTAWLAILGLGLGASALANLWWIHILSKIQASRAGMALFLIPVTSTALAVVALHEPLTLTMAAGGGLVLGSVALMQRHGN
jgi:drug/metabolite transporter (DMT)-like permease